MNIKNPNCEIEDSKQHSYFKTKELIIIKDRVNIYIY